MWMAQIKLKEIRQKLEKLSAQLLPHHMKAPINISVTNLSCTLSPALTLQM